MKRLRLHAKTDHAERFPKKLRSISTISAINCLLVISLLITRCPSNSTPSVSKEYRQKSPPRRPLSRGLLLFFSMKYLLTVRQLKGVKQNDNKFSLLPYAEFETVVRNTYDGIVVPK